MATYNLTDLTDPQKFKREYPKTVHAIDPAYWCSVEVGMYVKIRRNNEYLWVQVRDFTDGIITAEVYYKVRINKFNIGDLLVFNRCYVFDIYDAKVLGFIPGLNEFQSVRAATRDWSSSFIAPVRPTC